MDNYKQEVGVRWADLDPNFHLRHSVYYDWGAVCRLDFLQKMGLTTEVLQRLSFGPILFREECVFRKEIRMGDIVTIDLQILSARKDFSRWTIRHQIMKNDTLSAVLTVDGAWINVIQRKLAIPPKEAADVFEQMPRDIGFVWSDK